MKQKRITIEDVARLGGVSRQTVSRVLNGRADVAEETRVRIQSAMQELGYSPSLSARSLPQRRMNIIGLVIPYGPTYLFSDPHLLGFICGVDQIANQRGYNLLLSTARDDGTGALSDVYGLSAFERLINTRHIDGAVVVETLNSREGIKMLNHHAYPAVILGYGTGLQSAYAVHSDDRGGARLAVMHLLSLGHQHIGIISGGEQTLSAMEERLAGCQQALAEHGLKLDPALVAYGDLTPESGAAATARLLAQATPPTAIFALNDRMAIGCIQYLTQEGWSIPRHISVIGFDDIPLASMCTPNLTTVRQPALEMGRQAARLLLELIENDTALLQPIVLPAELIVRGSTGAISPR
ncbi:MAG: LacI family DNA-binding transcriptional regulator [Anaerolineae bacterium]|nr:LacI family DNA-binding transcriptional regulator [Anaerolineae bacterium]